MTGRERERALSAALYKTAYRLYWYSLYYSLVK